VGRQVIGSIVQVLIRVAPSNPIHYVRLIDGGSHLALEGAVVDGAGSFIGEPPQGELVDLPSSPRVAGPLAVLGLIPLGQCELLELCLILQLDLPFL